MLQTGSTQHKELTPEQRRYQSEIARWRSERQSLQTRATTALKTATEGANPEKCKDAASTRAAEECLDTAMKAAQEEYAAFTSALRSLLGLAYPEMPGEQSMAGPTGIPPSTNERVAEFDRLESQSKAYRQTASRAAYNQFKGGTEAPVFEMETDLRLLRLHLEELSFIYGFMLENH
jgi:hypothetical protein